jgi:hypothetical protein
MTDKQMAALVRSMWADLRKTEKGYRDGKDGRNWKNAERKREQILTALERVPVPALGPVLEDGPSMLTYAPTHNTDGVPLHPAFDAGFGRSGIHYWIGHIGVAPATGRTFKKGERIARIADQSGTDHVHWGVDVRALTGRSLLYGRTGSGPDYTWGSPTIGQQLASVLEA